MSDALQSNSQLMRAEEPSSQHSQTTTLMHVIERVAMDKDMDISKLEKMLDMQERVLDRNAKQQFTADLAAMQMELPRVMEHGKIQIKNKDGKVIQNTAFAKLEDINDAIRPVLQKYGFAITFRVKAESGLVWVKTVLSHRDGHSEDTAIPLPLDTSGSKNAVQSVGSTISYGKRYGLCAMLNISTGDDLDGASADDAADSKHQQEANAITKQQLNDLMGRLAKANIPVDNFCKKLRVERLQDLQANRYDPAVKHIQAFVNSQRQEARAQ